jgi:hypothetical protein
MWLFGMITIVEMFVVRTIEEQYPDDTWESAVTPRRLAKAQTLLEERQRRNQSARLLDCLQFPDKLRILLQDPAMREDVGAASMRHAKQMIKDFEALRNDLAHAQQITTDNWDVIVLLAGRIDRLMTRV